MAEAPRARPSSHTRLHRGLSPAPLRHPRRDPGPIGAHRAVVRASDAASRVTRFTGWNRFRTGHPGPIRAPGGRLSPHPVRPRQGPRQSTWDARRPAFPDATPLGSCCLRGAGPGGVASPGCPMWGGPSRCPTSIEPSPASTAAWSSSTPPPTRSSTRRRGSSPIPSGAPAAAHPAGRSGIRAGYDVREIGGPRGYERGSDRPAREYFAVICSRCGNAAQVPFKPRMDKPVYCSDCFRATQTA